MATATSTNKHQFPEGFMARYPSDKAPDWVIANLSIYAPKFIPWSEEKAVSGWIHLQLTKSRPHKDTGEIKLNITIDTWKMENGKPIAEPKGGKYQEAYPQGMYTWMPHPNAPDWVLCAITIYAPHFNDWITKLASDEGWINIDLNKADGEDKIYAKRNEWKKRDEIEKAPTQDELEEVEDEDNDSLPF